MTAYFNYLSRVNFANFTAKIIGYFRHVTTFIQNINKRIIVIQRIFIVFIRNKTNLKYMMPFHMYLLILIATLYISYYLITEARNLIRVMRICHQWLPNLLCNKCLLVSKLEFVRVKSGLCLDFNTF